MQCRALARRSPQGSLTVLGDIAQGTSPAATGDWPTLLKHLGKPDATPTVLDRGYRVPAQVIDYAGIGVIAADGDITAIHLRLQTEGLEPALLGGDDSTMGTARLVCVPAGLAKGLEFDAVTVVEPADIVAAEPRGLHRLYVALTRAVTSLHALHSRPLPAALLRSPSHAAQEPAETPRP